MQLLITLVSRLPVYTVLGAGHVQTIVGRSIHCLWRLYYDDPCAGPGSQECEYRDCCL